MQISSGQVALPQRPGLGVEVDLERIETAHALYTALPSGARDDATAMQFLIPNWKFNNKQPCMCR